VPFPWAVTITVFRNVRPGRLLGASMEDACNRVLEALRQRYPLSNLTLDPSPGIVHLRVRVEGGVEAAAIAGLVPPNWSTMATLFGPGARRAPCPSPMAVDRDPRSISQASHILDGALQNGRVRDIENISFGAQDPSDSIS
jgi:DNA-binding transcriptional LysR family regulator